MPLSGVSFSLLLSQAFKSDHIRSNGSLFNFDHLHVKIRLFQVLISSMLFADEAALGTHSLQKLAEKFASACKDFGPTIGVKKPIFWGNM